MIIYLFGLKMKIYKLSSNKLLFYHATIPQFAEEIMDSGIIKPSIELDIHYQGWNFSDSELGHNYGEAIFLSTSDEKSLAEYYASIRLRKLWEEISLDDSDPVSYDEDLRFIAIFRIYVDENSRNLKPSKNKGEYFYFGTIGKNRNSEAYWEGPEWVSREKEADEYYNKLQRIHQEMTDFVENK